MRNFLNFEKILRQHISLGFIVLKEFLLPSNGTRHLCSVVLYLVFNAVDFVNPLMASSVRNLSISHCLRANLLEIAL